MPKRKFSQSELRPEGAGDAIQTSPTRSFTSCSPSSPLPVVPKVSRLTSSFSIESLMRPSEPVDVGQQFGLANAASMNPSERHLFLSQAALLAAAAAAHQHQSLQQHLQMSQNQTHQTKTNLQQQQQQENLSPSSSRRSPPESPISPGGNSSSPRVVMDPESPGSVLSAGGASGLTSVSCHSPSSSRPSSPMSSSSSPGPSRGSCSPSSPLERPEVVADTEPNSKRPKKSLKSMQQHPSTTKQSSTACNPSNDPPQSRASAGSEKLAISRSAKPNNCQQQQQHQAHHPSPANSKPTIGKTTSGCWSSHSNGTSAQTGPISSPQQANPPAKEPKERSGGAGTGSSNHLLRPQQCRDPRLSPFECHLDNLDLWHRFHPLDTEMIITKQGRRMFPPVRVNFSVKQTQELIQDYNHAHNHQQTGREKYQVLMDILPYDNKRYRYAYHKSSWQQAGKADPPSPPKLFLHPDGPFTVDQLKRQVISFEKIKLTNNDANKHGYIVLNSMHKYQPRIHLVLWRGKEAQNLANAPISALEHETVKTFIFNETIFTAVTAYQNHSITKLKIDSNPFAKGFRDSSRLTDYDLDAMQDFMPDSQCPYSPPRSMGAGPPGFPHFLLAAGAPLGSLVSPLASSDPLLRDRTIMALDSFLQQQQQQQQQTMHQHHPTPPSSGPLGGCSPKCMSTDPGTPTQDILRACPPLGLTTTSSTAPTKTSPSSVITTPTSNASQHHQLEQLIMQHHQHQLAAVAAAMALGGAGGAGAGPPPAAPYSGPHLGQSLPMQQQSQSDQQHLMLKSAGSPKLDIPSGANSNLSQHHQLGHYNSTAPYFHPSAAQLMMQHHHHQMAALAAGANATSHAHQMELSRSTGKR